VLGCVLNEVVQDRARYFENGNGFSGSITGGRLLEWPFSERVLSQGVDQFVNNIFVCSVNKYQYH
jgi:hypothetical protein